MQKSYQKNEHEIYLENEAGERIAEILFPEVEPKVYCIQRTFVDDSLRGQGFRSRAERLRRRARMPSTGWRSTPSKRNRRRTGYLWAEQGGTVTATCSYAQHCLEKHAKKTKS